MKRKPLTPLPWEDFPTLSVSDCWGPDEWHDEDFEFVIHSCNAYPKLVEALQRIARNAGSDGSIAYRALEEIGEE